MPPAVSHRLIRCLCLDPCHRCHTRGRFGRRRDAARHTSRWDRSLWHVRLLGGNVLDEHPNAASTDQSLSHRMGEWTGRALAQGGLAGVIEVPIVLCFDYSDFQDYWSSVSTGPTRIALRLTALPSELLGKIEEHVRAGYLVGLPNGPRSFAIIVRAVRGIVPPCRFHLYKNLRRIWSPYALPLDIIGEDVMAAREMALCFALSGLTATATAQTVTAPEN